MNKIGLIIVIIIIIVILGLVFINRNMFDDLFNDNRIIAEIENQNSAWGFSHSVVALDSNGNIYKYNYVPEDKTIRTDEILKIKNIKERSNYIINNLEKSDKKLSKEDVDLIISLGSTIGTDIKEEDEMSGHDMGLTINYIYNYDLNKRIVLKTWGYMQKKNTSENTQVILDILVKIGD